MNNPLLHYVWVHILCSRESNFLQLLNEDIFMLWCIKNNILINWPHYIIFIQHMMKCRNNNMSLLYEILITRILQVLSICVIYIYIYWRGKQIVAVPFRRVIESLQIDGHREISSGFFGNPFLHSLSVSSLCLWVWKGFWNVARPVPRSSFWLWWPSAISGTSPTSPLNRRNSFLHIPFFRGFWASLLAYK